MVSSPRPAAWTSYGPGVGLYIGAIILAVLLCMVGVFSFGVFSLPIPFTMAFSLIVWRWKWAVAGMDAAATAGVATYLLILFRPQGDFSAWATVRGVELSISFAVAALAGAVVAGLVWVWLRTRPER